MALINCVDLESISFTLRFKLQYFSRMFCYLKNISLIFALIFIASTASAVPLGSIPTVEEYNWILNFSFKSDMWGNFDQAKNEPVRISHAKIQIPLYSADTWVASLSAEDESLSLGRTDFLLKDKRLFIGSHLTAQSVGLGLRKDLPGHETLFTFVSYNSAGEKSLSVAQDKWIEASLIYHAHFYGYEWMLAINQSNNRGFLNGFPTPYAGIVLTNRPDYTSMYGFLFMLLNWKPESGWNKEFRVTPFDASFSIEKKMTDQFSYSARTFYNVRSYLPTERTDKAYRFYYQEASVENSLVAELSSTTSIIYTLGYSFDRKVYESRNIYQPTSKSYRLNDDFYMMARLDFKL